MDFTVTPKKSDLCLQRCLQLPRTSETAAETFAVTIPFLTLPHATPARPGSF
jgi:hypothetical protein